VPATFHVPGPLRQFVEGRDAVEIADSPPTLSDALSALWLLYPALRDRIATEQGHVREHINIFIGEEDVRYTGGLLSPLAPNSEIWIVPNISGGTT
jgi:sulfur-carrier protein